MKGHDPFGPWGVAHGEAALLTNGLFSHFPGLNPKKGLTPSSDKKPEDSHIKLLRPKVSPLHGKNCAKNIAMNQRSMSKEFDLYPLNLSAHNLLAYPILNYS